MQRSSDSSLDLYFGDSFKPYACASQGFLKVSPEILNPKLSLDVGKDSLDRIELGSGRVVLKPLDPTWQVHLHGSIPMPAGIISEKSYGWIFPVGDFCKYLGYEAMHSFLIGRLAMQIVVDLAGF